MKKSTPLFKSLVDKSKQIKGFLPQNEAEVLYDIACKAAQMGPLLEIGSYCGKSTLFLGMAAKMHDSIVYAVDHHRGSEEHQLNELYFDQDIYDEHTKQVDTFPYFRQTLSNFELEEVVVPIVTKSHVAAKKWKTPLSLVFIDGSHTLHNALRDYDSWAAQLMLNGYLVIHDIFESEHDGGQAPYRVYQKALESKIFVVCQRIYTLGILQKICD